LRLKVDLRGDPATINFVDEKWLQANAQRLEALDRLSFTLPRAPGRRHHRRRSGRYQGNEVDWDLQPEGNNGATMEHYPSVATH